MTHLLCSNFQDTCRLNANMHTTSKHTHTHTQRTTTFTWNCYINKKQESETTCNTLPTDREIGGKSGCLWLFLVPVLVTTIHRKHFRHKPDTRLSGKLAKQAPSIKGKNSLSSRIATHAPANSQTESFLTTVLHIHVALHVCVCVCVCVYVFASHWCTMVKLGPDFSCVSEQVTVS